MNETMKNLLTTINKALSDAIVTVVQNVVKHCSGEEFSSVSPLVDYILSHPEYEMVVVDAQPLDGTKAHAYKVYYKDEEMACCILSYHIDVCNPGEIKFRVETTYSYDEK